MLVHKAIVLLSLLPSLLTQAADSSSQQGNSGLTGVIRADRHWERSYVNAQPSGPVHHQSSDGSDGDKAGCGDDHGGHGGHNGHGGHDGGHNGGYTGGNNGGGGIEGTSEDENSPEVQEMANILAALEEQNLGFKFSTLGDESLSYTAQDDVDILDDDYCYDEVPDQYINCTEAVPEFRKFGRRQNLLLGYVTNALSVDQIYRWKKNSVLSICVLRNPKLVDVNLNLGKMDASGKPLPENIIQRRSSLISVAGITAAYKYWNAANVGVQWRYTTDCDHATYVVYTGGSKNGNPDVLATADFPAQPQGYQHRVSVWDFVLRKDWQMTINTVLSHELGHAIGLAHNNDADNVVVVQSSVSSATVMDSTISLGPDIFKAIPSRDRRGAFALYNTWSPPTTNGYTVVALTPRDGPNPTYPPTRKCKWFLGICYY